MSVAAPATYVGQSIPRPEDVPLVKGAAVFVGDVSREGQLWARVVRSSFAHGRITAIDKDGAEAHPEVVAVFTGADVGDLRVPIRMDLGPTTEQEKAIQPPLAVDRVRYVGEPVAVVVARDAASAEDAASEVFVEVAEEAVVLDATAAAEPGAPVLHDALAGNVVQRYYWRSGDVDGCLNRDDLVVVRETLGVQRHTGVPLETRGLVAELDEVTGRLTVWGAAKVKFWNRGALAKLLDFPEENIELVEVEVGGGFGVRGEFYPEDFLIPWLAVRLRKPVKWIEDRAEHLVATNHSREQHHDLEMAATRDGTLVAFRDRAVTDMGAYIRTHGAIVPCSTAWHMPGPYRWEAFDVEQRLVVTNKTPTGTYRGPGGVEAAFVRERMLDLLAAELGIDPFELRARNLLAPDDMPKVIAYDEGFGSYTHDADYLHVWGEMLEGADVEAMRRDAAQRRERGERVGVGTAAFNETAVIGPWEDALVEPLADGAFRVAIGVGSVGQGLRTALGQIAADALGVAFERVTIDYHSTDRTPFGFGTFASRVTTVGGNAIVVAIDDLKRRAGEAGVEPQDAARLAELGIVGEGRFEKPDLSVGFGGAVAQVAVDAATGMLEIERLVIAADVGNPVNPMLVRGQLVGAAAQGVGGALLEELPYDEYGNPLATTFADYLLPTSTDVPEIECIAVPVHVKANPLGLGPAGENGIYAVAPAIANALGDALGNGPGAFTQLPFTPERVWAAAQE